MDGQTFLNLDNTTQVSLLIAKYIRNEMEDFHCKHLTDEQMKELNPIIRQAIYDISIFIKHANNCKDADEQLMCQHTIESLIRSIPDNWELPAFNHCNVLAMVIFPMPKTQI